MTIAGAALTGLAVVLLVVSLRAVPESQTRFRANWWALVCLWFGIVFMLTGALT